MWMLFVAIIKALVVGILKTRILKWLHNPMLRMDKWCEDKIGIDLIKQETTWRKKYPLLSDKLDKMETKIDKLSDIVDLED
jgi:hypothetical protein